MKHALRCHDFAGASVGTIQKEFNLHEIAVLAKIAPALKGLRPKSSLALSLALPISAYWLRLASRYRRFRLATHTRFIVLETPKVGALGGIRTHDPWLRRPILYPLSYERVRMKFYHDTYNRIGIKVL